VFRPTWDLPIAILWQVEAKSILMQRKEAGVGYFVYEKIGYSNNRSEKSMLIPIRRSLNQKEIVL
jgi:hypothetical protein